MPPATTTETPQLPTLQVQHSHHHSHRWSLAITHGLWMLMTSFLGILCIVFPSLSMFCKKNIKLSTGSNQTARKFVRESSSARSLPWGLSDSMFDPLRSRKGSLGSGKNDDGLWGWEPKIDLNIVQNTTIRKTTNIKMYVCDGMSV